MAMRQILILVPDSAYRFCKTAQKRLLVGTGPRDKAKRILLAIGVPAGVPADLHFTIMITTTI